MSQPPTNPVSAAEALSSDGLPPSARVIAVMGAKGGCGTSLVATHIAAQSAATLRTCLVDLDTCKGDIAGLLDLHSGRSMNPMLERIDVIDSVLLQGAVDVHPSGVHVITQPYELSELHDVDADEVVKLLAFLRSQYEVLVLDVGSRVHASALAALLAADPIVLVTTPEVIALRDCQRLMRLCHQLGVATERVRLVVNRATEPGAVAEDVISEQLGMPITAALPADLPHTLRAHAKGQLLTEVAPHAELTTALRTLWDRVQGVEAKPARSFHWPWSRP